jgi:hypothetical protein
MVEDDSAPSVALQLVDDPLAVPTQLEWAAARRDARRAAAFVVGLVCMPAIVAALTALLLFALTAFVLLAPVTAVAVTWLVWQGSRPPRPRTLRLVPAPPGAAPR